MKNSEKITKKLVDLAIHHYQERLNARQYAASASYAFSTLTAAELDADSANAAAFVAAMEAASENIYYTQQLAHVANEEAKARMAMRNYGHPVKDDAEHPPRLNASDQFFQADFSKKTEQSIGQNALEHHRSAFVEDRTECGLALDAAFLHYSHVHAVSFAAYVHAVAVAARCPNDDASRAAFTQAITARLSADLNQEAVSPGFFMSVMCSDTVNVMGIILLVAGLLILMTGLAGFAIGSVAAMTAGAGLSNVALVVAGGTSSCVGAGIFASRFFMERQMAHDNALSQDAVARMKGHS